MNKKTIFYIFLLLILGTCKISAQSTWEYYYKKDNRAEKIDFVEEISDNNLVTVSSSVIINKKSYIKSILKIHDKDTGKVIKETEYSIDTLSTYLTWVFYSDSTKNIVAVGSAFKRYESYREGYFLLTVWDNDLNLLKDTLFRTQPQHDNFYISHTSGNYTLNGDFILIANIQNGSNPPFGKDKLELFIRIDKNGDILKQKYKNIKKYGGIQAAIVEFNEEKYIVIGGESFILDKNFETVDSIIPPFLFNTVGYESYSMKYNDKYLVFTGSECRELGFYNKNLEQIKSFNLCKTYEEFGNFHRVFDFIDTSAIFVSMDQFSHEYFSLTKLNSNLEPYWVRYFDNNKIGNTLTSITATTDGGCIITGARGKRKNGEVGLYEYGSWMKKFDADGNSVGTSDIPKSSWEITVYPNPSQGDFKVDIGGNARDTRLKLFDMQGKLVKTYDNLISGINRLNLQNLSQGMYVWKMEKDGKILGSGKWVKR